MTVADRHILTAGQIDAVDIYAIDRIADGHTVDEDVVAGHGPERPARRVFNVNPFNAEVCNVVKFEHRTWPRTEGVFVRGDRTPVVVRQAFAGFNPVAFPLSVDS